MAEEVTIRPFAERDAAQVRALFITVNRLLSPPDLRDIARQMLQFAEDECRGRNVSRLQLSTAEKQRAALALYRSAGYKLVHEETVEVLSNKTVGSGMRRYYLEKTL